MNHLDMYIFMKFGENYSPLFTKEELLHKVEKEYGLLYSEDSFLQLYNGDAKPKTVNLVKRLSHQGFSNKTISKWLGITASTISIHLAKPDDSIKEYSNYNLIRIRKQLEKNLQAQEQFYNNYK